MGSPSQPHVLPVPPATLREAALQVASPSFPCTHFSKTDLSKAATTTTCPRSTCPPPRGRGGQALTPPTQGDLLCVEQTLGVASSAHRPGLPCSTCRRLWRMKH